MSISFKNQILISVSPLLDFYDISKKLLPIPFWFLPNSFPFLNQDTVLNTLFKLEADGLVNRSLMGKTKYVYLTKEGISKLTLRIANYGYLRELWDGKIRIVFFDIPEPDRKLRDELRLSLVEMGFVIWQRSVFISPHAVEAEVLSKARSLGVEKMVNVMLSDRIVNRNVVELAWELYKLKSINERYNIFISQADHLLNSKIPNYKKWVERCMDLRCVYCDILTCEPFLPTGITGNEYKAIEASEYFLNLGKKLISVLERV